MNKIFTLLFLLAISFNLKAQLLVTNGHSAQTLAETLAGFNLDVTNASVTGASLQFGKFNFTGTTLGVKSGVILSTGNIFQAVGPNNEEGTSTGFGRPGNELLSDLSGYQTNDAVVLQFDFTVQTDMIEFKYIFLSEEYNEFVSTGFNDVFAFFISGPGIVGEENLAVVPGTSTPVTINSINNQSFWQFYRDNTNGNTNIEFDGFTTLMTAKKTGLIPCQTYTLKLMIADGTDDIYDAGVLLQENSLIQANVSASAYTYSENNTALEGCIDASFTFQIDSTMTYDTYIPVGIGGTANNGVDYEYVDPVIVIPAGQNSGTIIIKSLLDGITEGQETIELYFTPAACEEQDTVFIYIDDYQPIEYTAAVNNALCNGSETGQVLFNISGGFAPYKIQLTDTLTDNAQIYISNPITGLSSGTYLVKIIDNYGCVAEDVVFGDIFNAGQTFLPDGTGVSYTSDIIISGFNPGQTLTSVSQINSITATMEHSYANDLTIVLKAPNGSQVKLKDVGPTGGNWNKCDMGEPVASGTVDNWNNSNITPGVGYEYAWTDDPFYNTMGYEIQNHLVPTHTYVSTYGNTLTDYYLSAGSYTPVQSFNNFLGTTLNGTWELIVTDNYAKDNGYIFEWSISLTADRTDSIVTIIEPDLPIVSSTIVKPGCGLSNGAIDITVTGGFSPFNYLWSNGATSQDLNNVQSGAYNVNIKGTDNCTYNYPFNLSSNGTLSLSAIATNENCPGDGTGAINLTVNGGTAPFSYLWSSGQNVEDISGLFPGEYTVSVTDAANCSAVETFTLTNLPLLNLSGLVTNEYCGESEGKIILSVEGGTAPYTYLWSNGKTTKDIDELSQGTYNVTVTDFHNCIAVKSFSVINIVGNCIPECDLAIINQIISDETCGNSNGKIDINIFTSNYPYTVLWSNSETTDDLIDLSAGNYTVTINDAEGCQLSQAFNINNQTSDLEILISNITNEQCGNNNGAIDITVTGGALPYSYLWSNGATTQDLANVHAGTYIANIKDANNCKTSVTSAIVNNTGTLKQDWGNSVNEKCNNNKGSIDITISGGTTPYSYTWSNGIHTQDLINLNEGSYSCTVTDANGCKIFTPEYTITNESGTLEINNIDIDNEICNNNQGEIELFLLGGTGAYSFIWNNGATSQNLYNISEGTYSATISDASGCSVSTGNLVLVNESGSLQLQSIETANEICGNSLGSVDISVSSGNLPISYLWSNGFVSQDLTGISEGNYSCIITDANTCQVIINSSIFNDQGAITVQNIVVNDEYCGNSNGGINLTIQGAQNPVTYLWNSGQNFEDLSNIHAGNYSCQVTDFLGCKTTASATVINNTGDLSLNNTVLTNEQCGQADGAINISVSGSNTPINYLWSNNATTQDLSDLTAGTYSCSITDNINCKIFAGPFTINNTSQSILIQNVAIIDETCGSNNGSIDLTISGGTLPITYLWSNGATSQDITGVEAGTYTYTITDATGCSISGNVTVNNNAGNLQISAVQISHEICNNNAGAIDISVSGGNSPYTYLWSNSKTTQDINALTSGNYHVTIKDINNCQITSPDYNILNNPGAFTLTNMNITDEQCGDGTGLIDVSVSNGTNPVTYIWSSGQTSQDINNLHGGLYSCIAKDANNCEITYYGTVNNIQGDIGVDEVIVGDETCGDENGYIDILVSGTNQPFTYQWSNGETTEDISDLNSGNYICVVTDNAGCQATYNTTVNDISGNFGIVNIEITEENCGNSLGAINISVAGGIEPYLYEWNNGEESQDLINITSGLYNVIVTDAQGCVTDADIELTNIPGTLAVSDFVITDEYCGNGEGAINITYSGAAEPVVFDWSNGSSNEDISNLSSGNYDILITDNNGCTTSETYFVDNITNGFIIENATVNNEYCGDQNGSINLTLTGGFTPYTFLWNNGETTEDLTDLAAGIYTCTISDNSGCIINFSEEIMNQTNGLAVNLVSVQNSYCGSETGSVDINVSGGQLPYTFIWSNGDTSEDLLNSASGTYTVTVTDANNCKYISEYTIDEVTNPDLGFANIYVQNDYCGEGQGYIEVQPIIWEQNYIFEINGTQYPFPYFANLLPGTYNISIIDGSCSVDTTVVVENDANFITQLLGTNDEVCGNSQGSIDIKVMPPQGNYAYLWSNGATTQDINNLHEGVYTCQITKIQNGCKDYITAEIFNDVTYTTAFEVADENCSNSDGAIDITVTGSTGFTYLWNTGATTQDLLNIPAGTYSCEINDVSGCTDYVNAEVVNSTGNMLVSYFVNDDYCSDNQGSIELNVSGISDYSVIWSNDETTEAIYNLTAGNYWVTVTNNENGCEYYNEFTINDLYGFDVAENITNSSCETCNDGNIDLTISPSGAYYFEWSNSETTEDVYNLLPGEYYVYVYNEWCYSTYYYTVDYVNNIDDTSDFLINIYPNPANRDLFIDYNLFDETSAEVLILDALGRIITKEQLNDSKGLLKVDMTDKANGIYFIKITSETETSTFKIVKK